MNESLGLLQQAEQKGHQGLDSQVYHQVQARGMSVHMDRVWNHPLEALHPTQISSCDYLQ